MIAYLLWWDVFLNFILSFSSPQPVMSQPYPVPIPIPQPKSRPLPDSRGIPDTLNLYKEQALQINFGQSIGGSAMRPTAFNWNHALGLQNFYFYCDNFSQNLHENWETEILQILSLITPHPGLDNLQLQAQELVSDVAPFAACKTCYSTFMTRFFKKSATDFHFHFYNPPILLLMKRP